MSSEAADGQKLQGPESENKKGRRKLIPAMIRAANIKLRGASGSQGPDVVNPVRNSSRALSPAGIILTSNLAAEQQGIISNGVNPDRFIVKLLLRWNR
jgi:hypothetical protein